MRWVSVGWGWGGAGQVVVRPPGECNLLRDRGCELPVHREDWSQEVQDNRQQAAVDGTAAIVKQARPPPTPHPLRRCHAGSTCLTVRSETARRSAMLPRRSAVLRGLCAPCIAWHTECSRRRSVQFPWTGERLLLRGMLVRALLGTRGQQDSARNG